MPNILGPEKRILGIDIDNVLNTLYIHLKKIIKKEFNKDVDITNYYFLDQLDLTDKERNEFILEHSSYLNKVVKPEWRCQFYLNELHKKFKLYIITARHYNMAQYTLDWLNKNNIIYDEIFFNTGDKVDVCKSFNIFYMIDDSPWVIRKLNKNKINCLIFDRPYNQSVKGEFITRVKDWQEIYNALIK